MADVVAVVGSPRKGGNTERLAAMLLDQMAARGFSTRLITLAGKQIGNCDGCDSCRTKGSCHLEDDVQPICDELLEAKGILLGSPVYSFGPTPQIQALCTRVSRIVKNSVDPRNLREEDRLALARGYPQLSALARKVGAAFAVARRSGAVVSVDHLERFFLFNEMFVAGSCYPNVVFGQQKGDALKDEEGVANLRRMAEHFTWLLERLYPSTAEA